MKTFISVTFLFLGGAYYALSDGPNFEPETREFVDIATLEEGNDVTVTQGSAGDNVTLASMTNPGSLNLPVIRGSEGGIAMPPEEAITLEADAGDVEVLEASAQQEAVDLYEVDGSRVNMRAGPGTNYLIVDTLNGGTDLEVLEVSAGWARVKTVEGDVEGWMAERLIAPLG
ncbi:SH3 domain-containing protein [Pseudoroseicyclus sp. H15]